MPSVLESLEPNAKRSPLLWKDNASVDVALSPHLRLNRRARSSIESILAKNSIVIAPPSLIRTLCG